ncbi:hypothetical protein CSOJ01_00909 [Colletotrichum sojae]|uniref:Uncharacterized protein n=1 Tax=Colletotrichum sojae TaxID=2175907 RepID=A0A8H6JWP4_9PEZI|nr:hypothetical protein CSOJ01_00909 [Colletotrichum sojae]
MPCHAACGFAQEQEQAELQTTLRGAADAANRRQQWVQQMVQCGDDPLSADDKRAVGRGWPRLKDEF